MDSILDSSTEELSSEERLILSSSKRQEPQGEEHDNSVNKSEPQVPSSSNQTRDSHHSSSSTSSASSSICGGDCEPEPNFFYGKSKSNNMSLDSNSHSAYNTLIIHHNNNSLLADTWIPASHEFVGMSSSAPTTKDNSNTGCIVQSSNSNNNTNSHYKTSPPSFDNSTVTSSELSEIPRDYLDQLTVLKHLAKEVQQDPISGSSQNLLRSASFSKSQPDLTQASLLTTTSSCHDQTPSKTKKKKHPHSGSGGSNNTNKNSALPTSHLSNEEVLPSVQILEILMRENSNLKAELVNARRKINIIQKLETELSRLQASHAALFESTERRESLERTARSKLSTEVKRLTAVNRELLSSSNSLQNLSPYAVSSDVEILKKDLMKKELTIAQLVSQNKELMATKERQEIELGAQRATLIEQRNHIDILDTALTNAQSNVLRLEEELRKKQEYVDKVSQLQRTMSSLQLSNEKREQSEKKLRTQLEAEVTDLKLKLASSNTCSNNNQQLIHHHSTPSIVNPINASNNSHHHNSNIRGAFQAPPPPYPNSNSNSNHNSQSNIQAQTQQEIQKLQDKLKHSEEKMLNLDSQVARWENFFASASGGNNNSNTSDKPVLVSTSVSSPNTPNSWSSRGGTPHFFGSGGGGGSNSSSTGLPEDLLQTQNRATDLEWKIKDLESRLSERDAMIRVLHLQNVPGNSSVGSSINGGYPELRNQGVNNNNISSGTSPLFSSYNSSSSSSVATMALPTYRESPSYSNAHGKNQVSVSLASVNQNQLNMIDPVLMYSKMGKCDSEPPSYANLPHRVGGSGSSLVKNSNESLQSTNGNSCGAVGLGSLSNIGNGSQVDVGGKSIDEQLKELDNQLLSKGPSGLKMQSSGLCCIPGFSHPGPSTRKGKVPYSLLESLNRQINSVGSNMSNSATTTTTTASSSQQRKPLLPPLPLPKSQVPLGHFQHPMQMQYPNHNLSSQGNQQQTRTSSGPPFISPGSFISPGGGNNSSSSSMNTPMSHNTTALSLSNSVDSILSDGSKNPGCNVFTPALPKGLPKGLPPSGKAAEATTANKCRSLERNKTTSSSSSSGGNATDQLGVGKYTAVNYDAMRCKSLDRRECREMQKAHAKAEEKQEKKLQKSSVSSKAAFFGQLLTRRSPSPSRSKEKDKEKVTTDQSNSQSQIVQPKIVRFPFSSTAKNSDSEHDLDAAFLDKQGRSSQSHRNRVSKWTGSSNLEAVQEQESSPWIQRRSAEVIDTIKQQQQNNNSGSSQDQMMMDGCNFSNGANTQRNVAANVSSSSSSTSSTSQAQDSKKWGKIVKTPFGLRYTFGSPKLNSDNNNSGSKFKSSSNNAADGNHQEKDCMF